MSASVIKGYARASSMEELDVVGSIMTIGPSVIMGLTCLYLRQAITANLCFHAFMLFAILTSGWSLSGPKNRILHREGSFAELPMPQEKHRARRYGFAMFSVGVSLYFVCRFLSAPGEYLGVNRLELRQTLDEFGVDRLDRMLVFSLYFSFLNPWLEEVFWRQVVRWRLRLAAASVCGKDCPQSRVKSACRHADVFSAVAYSAYHSVIISQLMPAWFNLGVAFPFLAGLAHVLNRVADSPRLGVDACVALHAGLDASAAFWILDLRFGFLDGAFP